MQELEAREYHVFSLAQAAATSFSVMACGALRVLFLVVVVRALAQERFSPSVPRLCRMAQPDFLSVVAQVAACRARALDQRNFGAPISARRALCSCTMHIASTPEPCAGLCPANTRQKRSRSEEVTAAEGGCLRRRVIVCCCCIGRSRQQHG